MHFGQCMKARSTWGPRERVWVAYPSTARRACKVLSRTILPLPLTRSVSPLPGIKKEQADLGMRQQIFEGVQAMVSGAVRYRQCRLV